MTLIKSEKYDLGWVAKRLAEVAATENQLMQLEKIVYKGVYSSSKQKAGLPGNECCLRAC